MEPGGTASTGDEKFIYVPDNVIKKSSPTSVTYVLYLPEDVSFNQQLDEIGLFMSNPLAALISGQARRSPLVAYRTFSDIVKTSDFSLIFRWTINF